MFTNRKKLILIIGLILIVLLCILGFISLKPNIESFLHNGEILPRRTLRLTIDIDQREEVIDQLLKFSVENSYSFSYEDVDFGIPHQGFYIEILQGSFDEIVATEAPSEPNQVSISFYDDPKDPAHDQTVDNLFNDLKSFISEIPNITITQEK
ncbi:MAG: hypothetical protein WBW94_11340 [Anaerolineales bacterium]